ncbi:MAG TPA: hypothetical protein V6C89_19285 [Drouetiella sp.]|jgi:hypothetical protein
MNKLQAIALSLTVLTIAPMSAARADEDGLRDAARQTVRLPLRAAGVATGLVVGVPMAVTRRASNRMIEYTNSFADKIGGHTSAPPVIFASIVGLPYGLLVGSAEGVYMGGTNAIQQGVEKPFSLESLSLSEKLEEH